LHPRNLEGVRNDLLERWATIKGEFRSVSRNQEGVLLLDEGSNVGGESHKRNIPAEQFFLDIGLLTLYI
jgi:hypothetical protein